MSSIICDFGQKLVHFLQLLVQHVHFDRLASLLFHLFENFQPVLRFPALVFSVVSDLSEQVFWSAHIGERHFTFDDSGGDAAVSSSVR